MTSSCISWFIVPYYLICVLRKWKSLEPWILEIRIHVLIRRHLYIEMVPCVSTDVVAPNSAGPSAGIMLTIKSNMISWSSFGYQYVFSFKSILLKITDEISLNLAALQGLSSHIHAPEITSLIHEVNRCIIQEVIDTLLTKFLVVIKVTHVMFLLGYEF